MVKNNDIFCAFQMQVLYNESIKDLETVIKLDSKNSAAKRELVIVKKYKEEVGWDHIYGLVQDYGISCALAMEIPQFCTMPVIFRQGVPR